MADQLSSILAALGTWMIRGLALVLTDFFKLHNVRLLLPRSSRRHIQNNHHTNQPRKLYTLATHTPFHNQVIQVVLI